MRVLVLWILAAPLLAWRAEGTARPFVVTDTIHTSGSSSPLFQLPTWESSLSIFGVQADGDAHLSLLHHMHGWSLNISLEKLDDDRQSQIAVSGMGGLLPSVVSKEEVDLSLDEFTWFSVFRSRDLVTLYNAGAAEPFLLYSNDCIMNETNFLDFNTFQVSSVRNASWDFIGDKYDGENEATVPRGLEGELQGVVEGIESRLGAIEEFNKTRSVNKLKKSNIKGLASELYWIKSCVMLINYYGYGLEGRNMTELVVDINRMIYQADDALNPAKRTWDETRILY